MHYSGTNGEMGERPLSLSTGGWRLPEDLDNDRSTHQRRVVIGHSIDQLPTEGEAPLILTLEDESVLAPARDAPLLRNEDKVRDHRQRYFKEVQSKLTGVGGGPADPDEELFKGKILPKYDVYDPNSVQTGKLELDLGEDGLARIRKDENPDSWADRNDATWKAPVAGAKGYFNLDSTKRILNDYEEKPKVGFRKKGAVHDKKSIGGITGKGFGFLKDEEGAEGLRQRGTTQSSGLHSEIVPENLTAEDSQAKDSYFSAMQDASRLLKHNKLFADPSEPTRDEEEDRVAMLIKNTQKLAESKAESANQQFRDLLFRKQREADATRTQTAVLQTLGKRVPDADALPQSDKLAEAQTVELDFRQGTSLKSLIGKVGTSNPLAYSLSYFSEKKRQQWLSLADQANGTTSVVHVLLPSERMRLQLEQLEAEKDLEAKGAEEAQAEPTEPAGRNSDAAPEAKPSKSTPLEPDEIAPEEKGPDLSKSTFAALQFFKDRGMLQEEKRRVYAGRGNDEKYLRKDERMENEDNTDGIKFDRLNKEGVALTKKQAFREMCWSFHNKQPKKLKKQKMNERIRQLQAARAQDPSKSLVSRALNAAQSVPNSTAYLDLSQITKGAGK